MTDSTTGYSGLNEPGSEADAGNGAREALLSARRRQRILDTIQEKGSASVRELARGLGVSPSTVRRDLQWLARRDLIARTWGGGVVADAFQSRRTADFSLIDRQQENQTAKELIAAAAAALVKDGDAVAIDGGSTTELVAPHLMDRRQLTVITPSLPLAWALRSHPEIELIVVGGRLQPRASSLVGLLTEEGLSQLNADISFIGARGLALHEGLTNPILDEVPVKRRLISIAKRAVGLVDSSKWGLVFLGQIAPISSLQAVITDAGAPAAMRREVQLLGTEVIIAE